uniref:Si:dkey-165a24.9 n=1 Tax=Hucho hucho TaxID=62062 RepID=A0A4W5P9L7_9TELE
MQTLTPPSLSGNIDLCNLPLNTDTLGLTYIYSLAFSLGLPCNLLSLWGLYQLGRSGGGGCQLVYILNLLLSDLLQLLTLPLWILYLQGAHRWPYGRPACEFVGYVFYVNVYASVVFLCLIALDRCLAIVHPLSSRGVRTVRVAAVSGVATPNIKLLLYTCSNYRNTTVIKCSYMEKYVLLSEESCQMVTSTDMTLDLCIFLAFFSYTSARIGVTLQQSPSVSGQDRHKITGILVVITVIFIVVFGPYHLVGGYRFVSLLLIDNPCELERSIFLCYRLCYGLTSLNTLLDPLFYIFLCHNARLELRRSLTPCLGRGHTTPKQVRLSLRGHPDLSDNV